MRSATPDPALVGRLSTLVADARASVTGANGGAWDSFADFITVRFPAEVYRLWRWWVSVAVVFVAVSFAFGWWIATHRHVQASLLPPDQVKQLVQSDFKNYYSDHPAHDFALHVWINNAWVAALSLVSGVLLGIPTVLRMYNNALNVGVSARLHGRGRSWRRVLRPDPPARDPRADRAVHRLRRRAQARLDGGRPWAAHAGPTRWRRRAARPVPCALGLVLVLWRPGCSRASSRRRRCRPSARIAIGIAVWMPF